MIPKLEEFLLRQTIGRPQKGLVNKLIPNHYQYSKNSIRIAERNGIKYHLDISDLVDWYLYFGFKDNSKEAVFKLINKGMYILDIGANVGDLSFNFAQLVGEDGRVYSFEPDKQNFYRFEKNYDLNNFRNISKINLGLGDVKGFYSMSANDKEPGNDGSKRIVASTTSADINGAEIITLDEWAVANSPTKIDIIKMDIEGYEYSALSGAIETLKKYKPILYLELHDVKLKEHGSSASELLYFIRQMGYEIRDADSNAPYTMTQNLDDIHDDIVCTFPNS